MRTTRLKTFSLLLLWTRSYVIKEKEKNVIFRTGDRALEF